MLRVACHPVVAGALFTITIVAMYTTPLFEWSLTSAPVHVFVHAHLLVVGLLFFWPLIGFDPAPIRVPHPARIGLLLLILPLHALLAVTLMDADPPVGGRHRRPPGPRSRRRPRRGATAGRRPAVGDR